MDILALGVNRPRIAASHIYPRVALDAASLNAASDLDIRGMLLVTCPRSACYIVHQMVILPASTYVTDDE